MMMTTSRPNPDSPEGPYSPEGPDSPESSESPDSHFPIFLNVYQLCSTFINFAQPNTAFDTEFAQFTKV